MFCDLMILQQKIILFFKLVYMNKFNLENCTNVKLNLNSFSLLRLITVDSRYLEFDGTIEQIRVNRSSTQEELKIPEVWFV